MQGQIYIWLIVVILSIFLFIRYIKQSQSKNIKNKIQEGHYRHVPLNYFTLQEPPYFFYDPDVPIIDNDNKQIKDNPLYESTLFGENNYLRYYPDNQEPNFNFNMNME